MNKSKSKRLFLWCLFSILTFAGGNLLAQEEGREESSMMSTTRVGRPRIMLGAIRLSPFAEAAVGWNSNVFKSPKQVIGSTLHGTVTDLEKGAMFYVYGAGCDARARLGRSSSLTLGYTIDALRYPDSRVADVLSNRADLSWRYRSGKRLGFSLGASFKDKNRKETDIFGEEYLRKYSYAEFSFSPALRYEFLSASKAAQDSGTEVRVSYERKNRNYEEAPPPTTSLDYSQDRVGLDLTRGTGEKYRIKLGYDQYFRRYAHELADTTSGSYNLEGIKREQNLFNVSLGLDIAFRETDDLAFEYGFRKLVDPYEGYNTYTAHGVAARLNHDIKSTTHLEAGADFESRSYETKTAPAVGPNPKLHMYYWKFTAELSQDLTTFLNLYAAYVFKNRDTNVERENWTIYRDYRVSAASCGLRLEF